MTDPRTYLQDVLAKADAATRGDWSLLRKENGTFGVNSVDGEFDGLIPDEFITPICRKVTLENGLHIVSAHEATPTLARALLAVWDKHAPVSRVFSWGSGSYTVPRCPDCLGRAGVHECGCWRDTDETYSCGECSTERDGVDWPCPTVTIITTELAKEIEHG